jgi:hypothetical protein
MSFTIAGAALSRLVVMTDCPNALIEDLTEAYQAKSSEDIEDGIRWFYCCGLGVALICTGRSSRYHLGFPSYSSRVSHHFRLSYSHSYSDPTNKETCSFGL